ncbi:NME NM23 member 5 [Sparganum proliferum]
MNRCASTASSRLSPPTGGHPTPVIYNRHHQRSHIRRCGLGPNLSSLQSHIHLAPVIEPIPIRESAKDYLAANVNPTLLAGLTEVCKRKPKEPVLWLADWLLKNNPYRPTIDEPRPVIIPP